MTADEQSFRDLWMAELWAPVPEWHPSKDERIAARVRNEALAVDEKRPRKAA